MTGHKPHYENEQSKKPSTKPQDSNSVSEAQPPQNLPPESLPPLLSVGWVLGLQSLLTAQEAFRIRTEGRKDAPGLINLIVSVIKRGQNYHSSKLPVSHHGLLWPRNLILQFSYVYISQAYYAVVLSLS